MTVAVMTAVAVLLVGAALQPRARVRPARLPIADISPATVRQRHKRRRAKRLVAAMLVVAGFGLAGQAGLAVLGAVAAATIIVLRRRRTTQAARRTIEAAMPDAIELFVVSLHAGRSPAQSIVELARIAPAAVRPAFRAVEHRLHRGHGVGDALEELTTQCGRCALALVTSVGAAVRDGLPLTPVLDRLTDDAHAARRRHGEAAARRLPIRLSFPLVACTLPSFVLLSIAPAVLGALSTLRGTAP